MRGRDDGVRLGVDVGGTFTDVVLLVDGRRVTAKVPTTSDQSDGVMAGIDAACEQAGVDPGAVDSFRHATTVAVNALLEGTGAKTALVTTEGFGDVLAIGRQDRPALYDLDAQRPDPLVPSARRHEVPERATPDGIETPVDDEAVAALANELADRDVESVAVSFLHAYAEDANERAAAETLRAALAVPVTASHEVLPTVREYERTATTVAAASVTPVIDAYLSALTDRARALGLPAPRVMQSNGGIAAVDTVRENAVTTVLSGPAAGVVGATAYGQPSGDGGDGHGDGTGGHGNADERGLVTIDMGGTSSDVSLVREGSVARTTEADVGGHPVRVPMVDVHTIGAGGGSVARVDDGGALRVGPESAGADPGPACYGCGGTDPTVTDAALELGFLGPDATLGGEIDLDPAAADGALADLADAADLSGPTAAARGVFRVATASMAGAIRTVTSERGHDPRQFALAAFGGAGPMHAAALADRLDIARVVVPPAEGVLSALGLLAADEKHDAARTYRTPLAEADPAAIESRFETLTDAVLADATDPAGATVERELACRYAGQRFEVPVPAPDRFDSETVRRRFHDAHERVRGYRLPDEPVTVVTLRVTATVPTAAPTLTHDPAGTPRRGERTVVFPDAERSQAATTGVETPIYDRGAIPVGERLDGPAIVAGGESTVVVPPAWRATARADGALELAVSDA